jgi:hypothetical protein
MPPTAWRLIFNEMDPPSHILFSKTAFIKRNGPIVVI